jgi:hypothetical protein
MSNSRRSLRIRTGASPEPEGAQGGYWSYLGKDVLSIPKDGPTTNLEGFTMKVPESEFHRVVRYETRHARGFPHEHMRRQLMNKIDSKKAIKFFGDTQGWSAAEVRHQVLTSIVFTFRYSWRGFGIYHLLPNTRLHH